MSNQIEINPTTRSRLSNVDFNNLGFGDYFSDHMFSMQYENGKWNQAEIIPYGPINMYPGALSLHYGQSVFEGLKGFHTNSRTVNIFRPSMNIKRLRRSCERLCIPTVDEDIILNALQQLINLDQEWIPRQRGQALYIRPLLFATEPHLQVRAAISYRFLIMTSPVREYYNRDMAGVALKAESTYTRAAPGGMGFVKTAGNYAATLLPGKCSNDEGFDQILWLDGRDHQYIEEVGQMNIFFKINGTIITPPLRGTILPGVTRDSVLTLLREQDIAVEERPLTIEEVLKAANTGVLEEVFGAGTAAVIAPVAKISYDGTAILINKQKPDSITEKLYQQLLDIQHGVVDDIHHWNMRVCL